MWGYVDCVFVWFTVLGWGIITFSNGNEHIKLKIKKIKSVAYSSQGSQTVQLDFCNLLADGSTTG